MQELENFKLKISVIPNGVKKCMSFTINDKLSFIDSFQFISPSWDSLVETLNKDNFKYLSQEFDNNVLDLVKRKYFFLMSIWLILKSLKNNYSPKKSFIVCLLTEKLLTKNKSMLLTFITVRLSQLVLKVWRFVISWCVWKI